MFNKWQTSARLCIKSALCRGIAALPLAAVLLAPGVPAHGRTLERLTAFDAQPIVPKEELAKLRGGFNVGNGITVNFGLQVQQFVNDLLTPVNQVNIDLVKNNFTVTQTVGGTTTALPSIPKVITPNGLINNGLSNLAVTLANSGIQSVITNSANNTALAQVTTLNVSTEGLANALRQAAGNNSLIQTIQMNSGFTHH
jgi:hypothetical protein